MRPRLVTIPISHYGERARWALDHAGVDYDEIHTLQMFSWFSAFHLSGRKTLPVLALAEQVLGDSALIVRWASARAAAPLYPADAHARRAIEAFEDELSTGYAVETRRIAYDMVVHDVDRCLPYNAGRAPQWQVTAFEWGRRGVETFARRYLSVNADTVARAQGETDRTMDAVAERLRDGRRFLFGDAFGAADLAFAAFSAPVLLPERYGVPLPGLDAIADDVAARVRARRAHPAGAFAMRVYGERPAPRGRYERASHVDADERAEASGRRSRIE